MKQKVSLGKMQFSSARVGSLYCPLAPWQPCNHLPGTLSPLLWLEGFLLTLAALWISPLLVLQPSCGCCLGRLELLGDGREFKQLKMFYFQYYI